MTVTAQMFQLRIAATAEIRDADGNLVGTEPVEATMTVTEDEARRIQAAINEGEPS